jgi:hypothetical protein
MDLAFAYQAQGKAVERETLAREAMDTFTTKSPDDWQRYRAMALVGASLSGEKKYEAAEPLLVEGYRGMEKLQNGLSVPDRIHLERVREWIVELYRAWGKPSKVEEWQGGAR